MPVGNLWCEQKTARSQRRVLSGKRTAQGLNLIATNVIRLLRRDFSLPIFSYPLASWLCRMAAWLIFVIEAIVSAMGNYSF